MPDVTSAGRKVAVCITTHDRVDCARINMEIMRLNYAEPWVIVHACSDAAYGKYLEDELVRCEPLGLTGGALNLLKQSIRLANEKFRPDYIVHLEADTWILDQGVINRYIGLLQAQPAALVAASSWSLDQSLLWRARPWHKPKYYASRLLRAMGIRYGLRETDTLSTQFFVARNDARFAAAIDALQADEGFILENAFYRVLRRDFGAQAIIGMREREPVRPYHRYICEALSLYSQHWPTVVPNPQPGRRVDPGSHYGMPGKRETLRSFPALRSGPHMQRLLSDPDLSYYNGKAKRY